MGAPCKRLKIAPKSRDIVHRGQILKHCYKIDFRAVFEPILGICRIVPRPAKINPPPIAPPATPSHRHPARKKSHPTRPKRGRASGTRPRGEAQKSKVDKVEKVEKVESFSKSRESRELKVFYKVDKVEKVA